jgi:hypothetical protein
MAKMTKAQMEAFKKKNFDKSKSVSKAQLDKLRKEGTPDKAIAKYKNDPAMREALNRFYGKDRVTKAGGSGSSSSQPSGPGGKMPKRPAGGPGAKMTARDGRGGGAKSSTSKPTSNKPSTSKGSGNKAYTAQAQARKEAMARMSPAERERLSKFTKTGGEALLNASTFVIPGGAAVKGGLVLKSAKAVAMANAKKQAAFNIAKRSTMKANDAMAKQKAATAAKNATKTGKGSGAGSASKAKAAQAKADAAKAQAQKAAEQARNANARARSLGSPTAKKTGPKSTSAKPKATASGTTSKQANDVLMNMSKLPRKYKKTTAAAAGAAYMARPRNEK